MPSLLQCLQLHGLGLTTLNLRIEHAAHSLRERVLQLPSLTKSRLASLRVAITEEQLYPKEDNWQRALEYLSETRKPQPFVKGSGARQLSSPASHLAPTLPILGQPSSWLATAPEKGTKEERKIGMPAARV